MVRRFQLIDAEFRLLAPQNPNIVVVMGTVGQGYRKTRVESA
jgi:hypothetical protein